MISTQKRKTTESSGFVTFIQESQLVRFLLIFSTFAYTIAILTVGWNRKGFHLVNHFTSKIVSHANLPSFLLLVTGLAIIMALVLLTILQFLKTFYGRIFRSNKYLIISVCLFVITIGLTKALFIVVNLKIGDPELSTRWREVLYYVPLLPSSMSSILYGILLNTITGYIFLIFICLCQTVLYGGNFFIYLLSLISLSVGIFASFRARRRSHLMRAGLLIGLTQSVFIIAGGLIFQKPLGVVLFPAFIGLSNGFLAAFFATGILPIFEYLFHATTDIRLLELSDLNHPLLKKLVIEAPGTYHHSLIVANLAEAAAEVVGANPLLTRVGAYFHDIGKIKKPEYFSENEWRGKSRHDDLIPSMSSLIIISHVKDGVDLAQKYRLNKEIVDIIQQHHGTSIVYFFYKRAEENLEDDEKVDETEYRYPGPAPQTKEAAIILLADAVEAASRSLDKPTPGRIQNLVHDIIYARIAASQLEDCQLTMKDIAKINDCFSFILTGIFHTRPKYPKDESHEENGIYHDDKEELDENSNKQSPEEIPDSKKLD